MGKVQSMTGFARKEGKVGGRRLTVEVKSVNNRYLDAKLRLPRDLAGFESAIQNLLKNYVERGRVDLWADYEPGDRVVEVYWNEPLARGVMSAMKAMKESLALTGEADLSLLAQTPGVIVVRESDPLTEEAWPEIEALFRAVFEDLNRMREREGETLVKDVLARVDGMEREVKSIGERLKGLAQTHRDRLRARIQDLIGEAKMSEDRLMTEAALLADRIDVTEEMVRLASHFSHFRKVLNEDGAKGRKLDFLIQEMFREITTLANKVQDAGTSQDAVGLKSELEKIREQIQNLQ